MKAKDLAYYIISKIKDNDIFNAINPKNNVKSNEEVEQQIQMTFKVWCSTQ